jgi:hypothetical protein
MKLSEVKITATNSNKGIRVETTTDGLSVLWNDPRFGLVSRDRYIEQYGDVTVEYDAECNVYRVPAFKVERDSYIKGKAATLAGSSYGCN